MALNVGSRLGHYDDVSALIGEGGMGQVDQATDAKRDYTGDRVYPTATPR